MPLPTNRASWLVRLDAEWGGRGSNPRIRDYESDQAALKLAETLCD